MVSIVNYGAKCDGLTDCAPAINAALKEESVIFIPQGRWLIGNEILIPSHRKIKADEKAVIFCMDDRFTGQNMRAAVTNSDYENGNEDITVEGGVWDGNNARNPRKDGWRSGPCQGLLFSFFNVKNLTLKNMTVKNSESYHFRLGKAVDFIISDIIMSDDLFTPCQDGIHVGGGSANGVIKNIIATRGSTNDDLIAFNADDANWYCHNRGMKDAPIKNMLVENVKAEDCWTAVRLLSVVSEISNVTVRNLTCGVREMGINLDATRYAGDIIFNPDEFPDGVGNLKNILFENITLYKTTDRKTALVCAETNGDNVVFSDFTRLKNQEPANDMPFFRFRNLKKSEIVLKDGPIRLPALQEFTLCDDFLPQVSLNPASVKK